MSEVKVSLNAKDEIALLDRYGRRCSRETLVKRALTEVLRQQADDVPLYVTIEEATAKFNADAEAQRLAAEAAKPLPEVEAILFRFKSGEKFIDDEGREVTAIEPNEDDDIKHVLPIIIQVDGENSEWFGIGLDGLKSAVVCICGHDGKLVSADCPVPSHAADAAAAIENIPERPDA